MTSPATVFLALALLTDWQSLVMGLVTCLLGGCGVVVLQSMLLSVLAAFLAVCCEERISLVR